MEKILSIIVPSYNTYRFIDECLPTFVSEKLKKTITVILVNDGSSDEKTLSKLREYEEKYPQIFKVIDKQNGGHGSTINEGIKHVSTKYFKVIDGDDFVDTDALEQFVSLLETLEVDLVLNSATLYIEETKERIPLSNTIKNDCIMDKVTPVEDLYDKVRITIHTITYNTATYKNSKTTLTEKCFYEDREYSLFPLKDVKSMYVSSLKPIYQYRIHEGQSVSVSGATKHFYDNDIIMNSVKRFYELLKANMSAYEWQIKYTQEIISELYCNKLINMIQNNSIMFKRSDYLSLDNDWKSNYPETYNTELSKRKKIRFIKSFKYNFIGLKKKLINLKRKHH